MKKVLLLVAVLFTATLVFATDLTGADQLAGKRVESTSLNGAPAVGKLKAGVVAGTQEAATVGFRPSDKMEFNAVLGYGIFPYRYTYDWFGTSTSYTANYWAFTVGVNALFTVADIKISGQVFPLSVGPAVNLGFTAGLFTIEPLGLVRWEYSFEKYPLNVFIETGAGVSFTISDNEYWDMAPSFVIQANAGVRYIF